MLWTYVETVLLHLWHSHALFTQLYLLYVFHPSSIVQHPNYSGLLSCKYCILPLLLADGVQMKTSFALKKKKELTFLGTLCSMRAKNHNTSLQGFSNGIDERWDSDGEREGFRGEEQRTRGERKVRRMAAQNTGSCRRTRRKGMAIKREGGGWGASTHRCFFPLKRGFLPLRKKIINTFAVAMPTNGLTLRS